MQMPVMNGVEATRRIRAFEEANWRRPCHIIALTGAYARTQATTSLGLLCSATAVARSLRSALVSRMLW